MTSRRHPGGPADPPSLRRPYASEAISVIPLSIVYFTEEDVAP